MAKPAFGIYFDPDVDVAHPSIHSIIYGEPGTKKSTFLATCPTPMLIANFDTTGKTMPYQRNKRVVRTKKIVSKEFGIPVWLMYDAQDRLVYRIEHYHDDDEKPQGFRNFRLRFSRLKGEIDAGKWLTIGVDSISGMKDSARLEQELVINPLPSDLGAVRGQIDDIEKRQLTWGREVTSSMASWLSARIPGYDCNVVLVAHHTEERATIEIKGVKRDQRVEMHDEMIRSFNAPGRLGRSYGLFSRYEECYHAFLDRESGHIRLQTERNDVWAACTQIMPPNPCKPIYRALFRREGNSAQADE